MAQENEQEQSKTLPPPWDRIFSLASRVFVWGLLFSILYILRPFFLLVFLTFVVAYILEHGVQGLAHRIASRPVRVVLVSFVFLGTLIAAGIFLAPHFSTQATKLADNYSTYLARIDEALDDARRKEWVRAMIPPEVKARDVVNGVFGLVEAADETSPRGKPDFVEPPPDAPTLLDQFARYPGADVVTDAGLTWNQFIDFVRARGEEPSAEVVTKLEERFREIDFRTEDGTLMDGDWLRRRWEEERNRELESPPEVKRNIEQTVKRLESFWGPVLGVLGVGSAFLLSLLFSFLIVLDLPKLSRAVSGLAETKIGFIYDEVAENIRDFGLMLGRALEAQLFIAAVNTALTAVGLWILGLEENMIFFSTVVFFCSFIPVAGVFLSSTPIALEALSQEGGGVSLMIWAILMILVIHFIEAYFLNPKIFGHHLHMNAVLVLIVLTISGKLVGVWGLILGLPVVNYFFGHAIRRRDRPNPPPIAPT